MHSFKRILISVLLLNGIMFSQNDLDALRYSRTGIGGSSRFISMGGAFGALGADVGCASYNPAGLGVYQHGEMIFTGGLRSTKADAKFEGYNTSAIGANFAFGNFGMAFTMPSQTDNSKRNTFCFSNNQILNLENQITISNPSTKSSIAGDMLVNANSIKNLSDFNPSYELLGYNSYVIDYDSASGKYFSFVDLQRNHPLSRTISTKGRVNELNLSFAQSSNDNYYFGLSVGIPKVKFQSTTEHKEADPNDSMNVTLTSSSSFTSTYIDPLPLIYVDKLGFNSLDYQETYSTTGYGLNLKVGGLVRLNPYARIGAYFHSPSILYLSDTYYYYMKTTFDADVTKPLEAQYPDGQGKYDYRIITPMKFGVSGAFIYNKLGCFDIDIENLNYQNASLTSTTPSDFAGVNKVIKSKYKNATNIRLGGEINMKPVMLRAGYAMYGSPFGGFFTGPFDRQTVSLGIGYRTSNNIFVDIAWARTMTKEKYYMYTNIPSKVDVHMINSQLMLSVGAKF